MGTGLAFPRGRHGAFHHLAASSTLSAPLRVLVFGACLLLVPAFLWARDAPKNADLWSLKLLVRPEVPQGVCRSSNPIDSFIAESSQARGVSLLGPADKLTWLRRVSFDLIGLPPAVEEQEEFLLDTSAEAVDKTVDRLLASEQYGVRYGRHWLDVLRYADVDERMYAQPGIHLWRDWVIHALNKDMPYDEFVRTQLTGYRNERTQLSGIGLRTRMDPKPEDL